MERFLRNGMGIGHLTSVNYILTIAHDCQCRVFATVIVWLLAFLRDEPQGVPSSPPFRTSFRVASTRHLFIPSPTGTDWYRNNSQKTKRQSATTHVCANERLLNLCLIFNTLKGVRAKCDLGGKHHSRFSLLHAVFRV